MSLFSVQLKVAANQEVLDLIGEAMSPTLYDALEPVPDLSSLPVNELRVDSLEKVIDLLQLKVISPPDGLSWIYGMYTINSPGWWFTGTGAVSLER